MLFSIESVFFGIHRLQFSMSAIIWGIFIESHAIFDNKLWTSRIAVAALFPLNKLQFFAITNSF